MAKFGGNKCETNYKSYALVCHTNAIALLTKIGNNFT